jgi:SpoVK/Ycf46/Vps4 family AAA+-type ATPase
MLASPAPSDSIVKELALLFESQAPLIVIEDAEEDRVIAALEAAAARLRIPVIVWRAHVGISPPDDEQPIAGTEDPLRAVAFIEAANRETVYHLRGFGKELLDPRILSRMKEVCRKFQEHRGAVVVSGPSVEMPPELASYATYFVLPPPAALEYYDVIADALAEVRRTREVTVDLSHEESKELYRAVRGLSLGEVRRIVAKGMMKDGRLDHEDIADVREAKRRILERTGVLSCVETQSSLGDVAGLSRFKAWIHTRTRAFREPEAAEAFGLSPPRGVLLIGVQGCGKSLAAKAVAGEWKLPVVRLDPANLFSKYVGETEKALRRALGTVEAMSPVVLWIDEMEKAFSQSRDNDGGVSQRLLGSLLAWLQEHRAPVFVVATANDITSMPPELLRKGRFDEIFFVDLPDGEARKDLFRMHLAARGRVLDEDSIALLSEQTAGFSGAEIEQAVVAGLHAAFASNAELSVEQLTAEVRATTPLSTTMVERVAELRAWADGRTVRAD